MSARWVFVAALWMASGAAAQELAFSPDASQSCLYRSGGDVGCIGVSAQSCIATPEGSSNVGRAGCYALEFRYWADRLRALESRLADEAREADTYLPADTGLPRAAPAFAAMQGQWAAYRDAFCAYEDSRWGGGTGAHSAVQRCLMTLTGIQVLVLEQGYDLH